MKAISFASCALMLCLGLASSTFAQNVGRIFHEKMPDVTALTQEMMRACAGMMGSAPISELSRSACTSSVPIW